MHIWVKSQIPLDVLAPALLQLPFLNYLLHPLLLIEQEQMGVIVPSTPQCHREGFCLLGFPVDTADTILTTALVSLKLYELRCVFNSSGEVVN